MTDVFRTRIGKLGHIQGQEGVSCFLLTEPPNIRYFTGYWTILSGQSPCAAVIVPGGLVGLVFPALEKPSLEDIGAEADVVVPWRAYSLTVGGVTTTPKAFATAVVEAVTECGVGKGGCVACDSAVTLDPHLLGSLPLCDVRDSIESLRMRKDPDELAFLRTSAEICARAMGVARDKVQVGVTETEVAGAIADQVYRAGCQLSHLVVGSGPRSALAHPLPTERPLGLHEPLMIDIGVYWKGYWTELARTFMVEPTDEWVRRYELVQAAQNAGRAALKEDAEAGEVDVAIRNVFLAAGHDGGVFTHSAGHGCGLLGADGPSIAPGNKGKLGSPSVWSLEPALYFRGSGGIRLEDAFVLDKSGTSPAFFYEQAVSV